MGLCVLRPLLLCTVLLLVRSALSGRVVVIGGGPVGLFTALEARDAGNDVTLIEKRHKYTRATTFRTDGLTQHRLRKHVGSVVHDQIKNGGDVGTGGEMQIKHMEDALLTAIVNRTNPTIRVLRGYEFVAFTEDGQVLVNETTWNNASVRLHADLLVAADGKEGKVASALKIGKTCISDPWADYQPPTEMQMFQQREMTKQRYLDHVKEVSPFTYELLKKLNVDDNTIKEKILELVMQSGGSDKFKQSFPLSQEQLAKQQKAQKEQAEARQRAMAMQLEYQQKIMMQNAQMAAAMGSGSAQDKWNNLQQVQLQLQRQRMLMMQQQLGNTLLQGRTPMHCFSTPTTCDFDAPLYHPAQSIATMVMPQMPMPQMPMPVNHQKQLIKPFNGTTFESIRAVFDLEHPITPGLPPKTFLAKQSNDNVKYVYYYQTNNSVTIMLELTERGSANFSNFHTEQEHKAFYFDQFRSLFDQPLNTCGANTEKRVEEFNMVDFQVFKMEIYSTEVFARMVETQQRRLPVFMVGDAVKTQSYKSGRGVNDGIHHASVVGRILRAANHYGFEQVLERAVLPKERYPPRKCVTGFLRAFEEFLPPDFEDQVLTEIYESYLPFVESQFQRHPKVIFQRRGYCYNLANSCENIIDEVRWFIGQMLVRVTGLYSTACPAPSHPFGPISRQDIMKVTTSDHQTRFLLAGIHARRVCMMPMKKSLLNLFRYFEDVLRPALEPHFVDYVEMRPFRIPHDASPTLVNEHFFSRVEYMLKELYVEDFLHYNTIITRVDESDFIDWFYLDALEKHFYRPFLKQLKVPGQFELLAEAHQTDPSGANTTTTVVMEDPLKVPTFRVNTNVQVADGQDIAKSMI